MIVPKWLLSHEKIPLVTISSKNTEKFTEKIIIGYIEEKMKIKQEGTWEELFRWGLVGP